jgi:hypothetical protein
MLQIGFRVLTRPQRTAPADSTNPTRDPSDPAAMPILTRFNGSKRTAALSESLDVSAPPDAHLRSALPAGSVKARLGNGLGKP